MSATEALPLPLRELVEERLSVWRQAAEERGCASRWRGSPSATRRVPASPGQLEQVLDNVLYNALEVSPDGTTSTVRVSAGADSVEPSG